MPNVSLVPGCRYIKDGTIFKIIKTMNNNNIEVEDENTKRCSIIQQVELVKSLFEGKLRFQISDISSINLICSIPDFSVIEGKYHDIAVLRYKCIEPLLNISSKDRTIKRVKERIEQVLLDHSYDGITKGNKLHRATVYRWLQNYEKSGRDIRSLLPSYDRCGGRGGIRIEKELEEFISQAIDKIYHNKMRQGVKPVYEYVQKLILDANKFRSDDEKLPSVSYNTVRRRIKALDIYDATKHRYDLIEAEKRYGTKGKGIKPTRPLEWVEIDHTKADIFVREGEFVLGRPWITFMVDKYSRYPLGFHIGFDEPSYLSVMHCLYHSICPKDYVHEKYPNIKNNWSANGIPETLVVDNGKEFHSSALEDACLQLNINLQYSPPRMPWYKGTVERSFGELNSSLLNNLPGKSFSSWDKRGSYDPVQDACVSFESFNEIIHRWFIDIYSKEFHRGINGIPQELWNSGIEAYPPHLPCRKEDLIVLLGAVEERTITPKGIEFMGLFYNSRELIQLLNSGIIRKTRRIRFKYNPNDLSRIWVYDEVENRFIEVEAVNQLYAKGLSIWKHRVVINHSKRTKERVDAESLIESKAEIENIVERDRKELAKKRKSSPRIAKWRQVSSNAGIAQEMKDHAIPEQIDSTAIASKVDISDYNHGISDIGTCCDMPEIKKLDPISSDITIIGNQQEDLTEEKFAADYRSSNHSAKNDTRELGQIPKDEMEFDLRGWIVSYKTEWQQKEPNKKSLGSATTEEGYHGK